MLTQTTSKVGIVKPKAKQAGWQLLVLFMTFIPFAQYPEDTHAHLVNAERTNGKNRQTDLWGFHMQKTFEADESKNRPSASLLSPKNRHSDCVPRFLSLCNTS